MKRDLHNQSTSTITAGTLALKVSDVPWYQTQVKTGENPKSNRKFEPTDSDMDSDEDWTSEDKALTVSNPKKFFTKNYHKFKAQDEKYSRQP